MADETSGKRRSYRKRVRAEHEAQTRLRITEAAVRLHGTIGPARTTVSGVAEEAGVQRATVYRHFPDEESLFLACSAHWAALNPPPDPSGWSRIADVEERLREALTELYRWYAWAEPMLVNVRRDAPLVPAMRPAGARFAERLEAMRAALLRGRRERGARRRGVAAAIGHALTFETWRSLVRVEGLEEEDAVVLMLGLVADAEKPAQRRTSASDQPVTGGELASEKRG
jgi:AcrR family transcriptional regulator